MRKGRDGKTEIGLWVADNRNRLGMSVPDLEGETGYSRSSIAKVEGGSNKEPSKAIIGAIFRALRKRAAEIGDVVPEPPGYGETGPTREGEAGLTQAISALVVELQAMRQERESFEARLRALESEIESLRAPREGAGSPGRSAPHETAGLVG